jgi:hypothetical protein
MPSLVKSTEDDHELKRLTESFLPGRLSRRGLATRTADTFVLAVPGSVASTGVAEPTAHDQTMADALDLSV